MSSVQGSVVLEDWQEETQGYKVPDMRGETDRNHTPDEKVPLEEVRFKGDAAMNLPWIIRIVLALALLAGLGYALHHFQADYDTNKDVVDSQVYSGRAYLTNEEYDEFKIFLAEHPDIYILELDVLASDNPLVTFSITTHNGTAFPWGELASTHYKADRIGQILMSILVTLGALVSIALVWLLILWLERLW